MSFVDTAQGLLATYAGGSCTDSNGPCEPAAYLVLSGTILQHIANLHGVITPEYSTANFISVGSELLSVSIGLVAMLASGNLLCP